MVTCCRELYKDDIWIVNIFLQYSHTHFNSQPFVKKRKRVKEADIVLRGYAGWNSRRGLQVLDQVFPKTADVQPDLVIVYFGSNDSFKPHPSGLGPHVPLREYIDNMRKIALHVKSLSEKTRVIFLSSTPMNEAQCCKCYCVGFDELQRTDELSRVYAEACVEMCKELNIKVIDLWSVLQKRSDWLTACFTDGIHLSPEGSKMVAEEILTVLKEADWEPNLHWKSLPSEFAEDSPYDLLASDDIVLRGYAGWNSRRALQVLDKVFPKTADVQPDLVIVYFGGNDSVKPHPSGLGPHVPLPEYIENMTKIGLHIKSLSEKTRVIFLSSPPMNEAQCCKFYCVGFDELQRTNELSGVYAEACVEMCKELNIKVIDLWSVLQKRNDWLTACFTDGIHLSPEGSKMVAKEILTILEETDWEPNLHWKSLPSEFAEDSPYDLLASDGKTTLNVSDWDFYRKTKWS